MEHIFREGKANHPVFIMLHGTGGNETNLLPLGEILDPEAAILAIRGDVVENGMLRYFKRKEEGVYDVEDLNQRGEALHQFIVDSSKEYNFNLDDAVFVGFSNGSNIAMNILLRDDSQVNKGALFAPMYPVDLSHNTKDMKDVSVYLSMGENDPIVSLNDSKNVIDIFEARGADVTTFWVNSHELNGETAMQAKLWLNKVTK